MAKLDFLRNLKTARNLFVHRVRTDRPAPDPKKVEGQLQRAALWLTPSAVAGFDIRDFAELPSDAQTRLQENIERFARAAKQVPPTGPATPQQIKDAMPAFLKVLELLNPYLPADGEAKQIREALEGIKFPQFVLNWEFELGPDSTGEPAVWVWVIVDDAAGEEEGFTKAALKLEEQIREALLAAGVARWPYVRFRTATEQRAL